MAAGEYLRSRHADLFNDAQLRAHFHGGMFHGYDFDNTMLRIGSMNMALHGVDTPNQIEFIEMIVQELTQNGSMDPARLFESPYKDVSAQGPLGIFPPTEVTRIVGVLNEIRQRAVA